MADGDHGRASLMPPRRLMRAAAFLQLCLQLSCLLQVLGVPPSAALKVGVQLVPDLGISVKQPQCSRKCESEDCTVPPLLRYGKYCGILYTGCPGEKPCDGLDACCQTHDACVSSKHDDYLSQKCNENLLDCITRFRDAAGSSPPTFSGNKCSVEEVADVISVVIEAALLAGRVLHKP